MKKEDIKPVRHSLNNYYQSVGLSKKDANRVVLMGKIFATQKEQPLFLRISFQSMKHGKFEVAFKRFMHLLNELLKLGEDEGKNHYGPALSAQIIEYYLYFLPIILEKSLHSNIMDLKTYRLRWAGRISDHSFFELKDQVSQKFNNFNLDIGLPPETLDGIREKYKRRGLKQDKIERYLGQEGKQKENRAISKQSISSSSSEEDEYEEYGHKQVKPNAQVSARIYPPKDYDRQSYEPQNVNFQAKINSSSSTRSSKSEKFFSKKLPIEQQILSDLKSNRQACVKCGKSFIARSFLQQHLKQHFDKNTASYLYQNKPKSHKYYREPLLNQNSWISHVNQLQIRVVKISQKSESQRCWFCSEKMSIVWNQELQQWVNDNAISIQTQNQVKGEGISICHYECYYLNESLGK